MGKRLSDHWIYDLIKHSPDDFMLSVARFIWWNMLFTWWIMVPIRVKKEDKVDHTSVPTIWVCIVLCFKVRSTPHSENPQLNVQLMYAVWFTYGSSVCLCVCGVAPITPGPSLHSFVAADLHRDKVHSKMGLWGWKAKHMTLTFNISWNQKHFFFFRFSGLIFDYRLFRFIRSSQPLL